MAADEVTGESTGKHESKSQKKRAQIMVAGTVALVILTVYLIYRNKSAGSSTSSGSASPFLPSGVSAPGYSTGTGGSQSGSGIGGQLSGISAELGRLPSTIVAALPASTVVMPGQPSSGSSGQSSGITAETFLSGRSALASDIAKAWGVPISALEHYVNGQAVSATSGNQVLSGHIFTRHTRTVHTLHPNFPTQPIVSSSHTAFSALPAVHQAPMMQSGVMFATPKLAKKG